MIDTFLKRNQATILVIEDSPTQSEQLKFILEQHNFSVSQASNGNEALAAIERERPSIVISDIIMPEMDGYQLCRIIKTNERLKDIPVILLTSLSEPKDVLKGLECGADNFIIKPYNETNLVNRVQHILINEEMRKETKLQMGVEISFYGQRYLINSDRKQILDLLLSTYEAAVQKNHDLSKTRDQLNQLNEQLEQKVEERTASLMKEVNERRLAEDEIRKLNAELEQRVIDRTAQLESANRELEAFSFSVSHDLRAPLRSIDGFSRALQEEYRDRLDEQGQDYLRRIRNASRHMEELIHEMLKLSRVTLEGMKYELMDLSALARSVAAELLARQPDRQVEIIIQEGMTVRGDRQLFRLALENLLDNALKFTGRQESARIEAGAYRLDGQDVYYIRDNGAGFDMAYADKLFTPFQRLHDNREFNGTGVGLSIVKRVIQRHNGKVWAEGAVNRGATFSFTMQ